MMVPTWLLGEAGSTVILSVFLLFCRIGACLMVIPGFSSDRIPMRIRLFVAIAVTLALSPLLVPIVQEALPDQSLATVSGLIISELIIGFTIGLLGRVFMIALETMATLVSMAIGLSNMPGVAVDSGVALPAVANLVTLTATALVFISNQHWEVLRGLADSYAAMPPGRPLDALTTVERVGQQLAEAFILALRVCSPFIVYTVVINLAVGLVNKLTPQIPVYFIALPFIIAGGLYFLYLTIAEGLLIFMDGYFTWLQNG